MSEYSERFRRAIEFARSKEKSTMPVSFYTKLLKIVKATMAEKSVTGEIQTVDISEFNSLTSDQKIKFVDYMSR